jgi:hypothetical protein
LKEDKVTLMAIGDIIINRQNPRSIFDYVVDVIKSGDIRFANCDQMYSDKGYPALFTGTWSDPRNIPALTHIGLDVVSMAKTTLWTGVIPDLSTPWTGSGKPGFNQSGQAATLRKQGSP